MSWSLHRRSAPTGGLNSAEGPPAGLPFLEMAGTAGCSWPIAAPHPPAPLSRSARYRKKTATYERAEYLFKRHSRRISRTGLTLHRLRHSAPTALADSNVSLLLLMDKSRPANLRSLQWVHPPQRPSPRRPRPTTPLPVAASTDTTQHRSPRFRTDDRILTGIPT